MNLQKTEFQTTLPNGTAVVIDQVSVKKGIMRLKALHHKLRIAILKLLDEHGQMTVTEIFVKLRIEQSVASQQLAILRNAEAVIAVRDGKFIHYSINPAQIDFINTAALNLLKK